MGCDPPDPPAPYWLRARRLLAEDGSWLEGGSLLIANGIIREVSATPPGSQCLDFGDLLLVPGLINAHTHLELSHAPFSGQVNRFTDFLKEIGKYRPGADGVKLAEASRDGIRESLAAGTTAVLDLATTQESARALAASPLEGILFSEVLGLNPLAADRALLDTQEILAEVRPGLEGGIFLHAPYSLSKTLRRRARDFARETDLRLATHLFESREELDLLTHRRGGMERFLTGLNFRRFLPRAQSLDELIREHAAPDTLLVHLASIPTEAIAMLPAGTVAVLCPRSNRFLAVGPAPYRALRNAGVTLALGTDSRASCPNLDMREEMRVAVESYGISPAEAFRMATIGGAAALGSGKSGRIAVGNRASLAAFEDTLVKDPFEALLDPSASLAKLFIAGNPVQEGQTQRSAHT